MDKRQKFFNYRFMALLAGFLLVIFILTSMVSCSVFSNYYIEKETYDSLKDEYNKNLEEFQKQKESLEYQYKENEKLLKENAGKDLEIDKLDKETDYLKEEILMLAEELDSKSTKDLEEQVDTLGKDPKKLRKLLDNINDLLKFTYFGSSAAEGYGYSFTAFSIEYGGKYYIVTAGHCVSDNYGDEGTFKFKANFSDKWIYPELIAYKSEFWDLNDYAVFYGGNIPGGLQTGEVKTESNYLLGSLDKKLSVFRNLGDSSQRGESGSPVINDEMQVIGVYVVYGYVFTPIQLALSAIDSAVIN